MKRCRAAVIVAVVVLSLPAAQAADESAAGRKLLERLAGRWTWTGQQASIGAENSPYGQAGRFVGSGEARLIMDGQFILDKYEEKSPEGNVLHGVSLINYDPIKKCFVARDCMSDGSTSVAELTFDGRLRKDRITFTSRTGETLLARTAGEYSSDWRRLEVTWEGSTDNGATWKHWCTAVVEKTGQADNDEQELIRLQHEWSRIEVAGDVDALDRLLADEYVLTLADGTALPKAAYLRDVRSEETRSTAMSIENPTVRLYGDMALAKGIVKYTEPSGKKHEDLFHETWLKRDGRWQCLATQESEAKPSMADSPELSPEMKKLEGFVGEWIYEGEQMEPPVEGLPFGGAGTFSGKSTVRFVLDGAFQESRFRDAAPGTAKGVGLTGYDPREKCYVRHGYVDDGSQSISTATLDGHIWKIDSVTTTSKGDKVPVRYIEEYASDWSSYTGTVEASPDNGKTWKFWWKERGKKVK